MIFVSRFAVGLTFVTCALFGQEVLDDVAIGRLVKAGIGEQTIIATINQQPGKYALSADDLIALKKAGVSDRIMAAMIARHAATGPGVSKDAPVAASVPAAAPTTLALHDATPIRLKLTRDLSFTNIKPGEMFDFETVDDLRIDGLLVMARGLRVTATIAMAEPKTRMGRGGKLGVELTSISLLNGDKVPVRPGSAPRGEGAELADGAAGRVGMVIKPGAPRFLFTYDRTETFPEGTNISVYTDGEMRLDAARFLMDIAFLSNPPGALVIMYGSPIGRTPFTTRLSPGTYKAIFSRDGYYDLTQEVTVGPGRSNTVNAAFESK